MCRQCTSQWYYVIGTSPRSARSKLRFLSFCDQYPWKDVKSLTVFFLICIHGWLNFSAKIEKNKGDRDFKTNVVWKVYEITAFWHKYSILNFHIGFTKLVGALSVWEDISRSFGYSSLINVKTGARRITCLYELSSVLRPRRRATKDYSSSRIMHLVPIDKVETKNQTNCFVCLCALCVCFFLPQLQLIS